MEPTKKPRRGRPSKKCSGNAQLRAKKLKILRKNMKKTQMDFAKILNCCPDQISKQECLKREIPDITAIEYSEKLNIEQQLFLSDDIDEKTFEQRIKIPKDRIFFRIPNNLPPSNDYEFIGREKEINELLKNLSQKVRFPIISITGVGGVGKTVLAVEVAKICIKHCYYDAVVWSTAKKEYFKDNRILKERFVKSNLDELLSNIFYVLKRDLLDNLPDYIEQMKIAKRLLSETKTLLIVDNMETIDDDQVRIYLDEIPEPSKVLITDRRSVQTSKAVRLLELSDEESIKIIQYYCQLNELKLSENDLRYLAEMMGGIPLAIKWAVAQLTAQHWDLKMLKKHLNDANDSPILDFLFKESFKHISKYSKIILTTLAILPVPMTGSSLSYYNNIPENETEDSLAQLMQYALISRYEEFTDSVPILYFRPKLDYKYKVVPLIKHFLSKQNDFSTLKVSKLIISILYRKISSLTNNYFFPSNELTDFVSENLELILFAMEQSYRTEDHKTVINMMEFIGPSLGNLGKHDIRLRLGEMAVDSAQKIGDKIGQSKNYLYNIGWVYFLWYQYEKCEESVKKGINLAKESNSEEFEAIGIRTLGLIRKEQNKYKISIKLLLKSVSIFEKIKSNGFLASTYGSLASLYRDIGEYKKAMEYFEEAFRISKNIENGDEIISILMSKRAKLLLKQGKLKEANYWNNKS